MRRTQHAARLRPSRPKAVLDPHCLPLVTRTRPGVHGQPKTFEPFTRSADAEGVYEGERSSGVRSSSGVGWRLGMDGHRRFAGSTGRGTPM
jgi:hypothetical protein